MRVFRADILLILRELIDVRPHFQIDEYLSLSGINTLSQHPYLVDCPNVKALVLGNIKLYVFFRISYLRHHTDLVFLYHVAKLPKNDDKEKNIYGFVGKNDKTLYFCT